MVALQKAERGATVRARAPEIKVIEACGAARAQHVSGRIAERAASGPQRFAHGIGDKSHSPFFPEASSLCDMLGRNPCPHLARFDLFTWHVARHFLRIPFVLHAFFTQRAHSFPWFFSGLSVVIALSALR